MWQSLLFWLKYWLVFPGCTSYASHLRIENLTVFAFGRESANDIELRWIGQCAKERWSEPTRLLHDLRSGYRNHARVGSSLVNRQIAAAARDQFERSRRTMHLWLPWDVAIEMNLAWLRDNVERIYIVFPDPEAGGLEDQDMVRYVCSHLPHPAEDIPHCAIIAHQDVIVRLMILWQRFSGSLPIVPAHKGIVDYHPLAIQNRAKSAWRSYVYEVVERCRLALHGQI